jgi:hypothetical protein
MAFMAVLNPEKPKRFDGKKKKVTWSSVVPSSVLAKIGDNAMRSSLTPCPPLLLGPTLPADTVTALTEPALDTEIVELADVDDVELTTADKRKATLLDSGASTTFLTTASARAAQLEGNVRVKVSDAQGKVFNAYGGGALFGMIKDKDGEWRKEQVAINAYESPAFADDLLSWPSLKKLGWTLRSGPREGNDFLTSPDNRHYPLTSDSAGLLFLDISLCPRGSSARSTARVDIPESRRAFMAVLSPGKPRRIDSRKRQVRWAENFATAGRWVKRLLTGGGATGGVDNGGVDAAVDVFPPEPTLDSELVERTDVDVIELTAEDERKALADSLLKVKHNNYLTLHCAFNHNEAAIERVREDKSIKFANVQRPPDFACHSCAAASNSSAKFSHGRSAPDPASLVPFHDVEIDVWGPFDAGDHAGNRYAFLGIDRATGKRYFQPMSRKSGCVVAMQQYMALVKSLADKVEFKHKIQKGNCAICVDHSDRGGEFMTTYGFTHIRHSMSCCSA